MHGIYLKEATSSAEMVTGGTSSRKGPHDETIHPSMNGEGGGLPGAFLSPCELIYSRESQGVWKRREGGDGQVCSIARVRNTIAIRYLSNLLLKDEQVMWCCEIASD